MPSSLEIALSIAKMNVDVFGQGTVIQPKEGSPEWFQLRAAVLAYSYLRQLDSLGLGNDVLACEKLFRVTQAVTKGANLDSLAVV